jgi:hypothetical protein
VALMVWMIRVLIIGTFSMAGDRLFSLAEKRPSMQGIAFRSQPSLHPSRTSTLPWPKRPAPKPEPTYEPVGMAARPQNVDVSLRK